MIRATMPVSYIDKIEYTVDVSRGGKAGLRGASATKQ